MKLLFASDLSFYYMKPVPDEGEAKNIMSQTAEIFKQADYSIVNLENVFGNPADYEPIPKSGPNLITDDGYVKYLEVLHPTAVGMANNHSRDYGDGAMFHTMEMLKTRGYQVCGVGETVEKAYEPAVFDNGKLKVHIIAVCENEFGTATAQSAGTAGYSLARVTEAIKKALLDGAEPIIYFHGGNEGNPFPSPEKVDLYRHFADLGARAVIAMHTHCPQGYELYNGCPIIYSMGNFFFPSENAGTPTWNVGYMTMLELDEEKEEVEIIPYVFDMNSHTLLDGERKERFMEYLEELSKPISDQDEMLKLFEAWCTIMGIGSYLKYINFQQEMYNDVKKVSPVKNLLSCEAHIELMKHSLRLIYEGRTEEARTLVPYIEQMQTIII